ncbi:sugar porter (SP) family MFS transporter [Luteibacter rhizovicinus]|uniref:Sugar porter (SP) family MFS transporter n=1 Tax=Luteibacter rhizovicinus TaxID=242606 RepID=A0A4R3YM14_9GAMM|nr:sugar porter (SP) family MFS transporter [Luteibacter rhizovicinus]
MTIIAIVAAIAGGLYGYDTGIISGALLQISSEFSLGHRAQELVAASILAGAVVGAIYSTRLSARIGRRATIMVVAAIYTIGVLAAALAPNAWYLAVSRLVLGFAVGGSTQIVPTYIAELAPADKRGRLVTYFNVSIGIGILLAAIVGVVLQNSWTWRWMIGVAAVPSLVLLFGMTRLPCSPRWLVEQSRHEEARETLMQVRTSEKQVHREVAEIQRVFAQGKARGRGRWRDLGARWVRPAVVAGLGVAAFTQLSGIEMMIYYTPTFLTQAGFGHSSALLAALGVAITYLTMTFIGKLIVDHVGRRRLTLWMMPFAAASLVVLGALFHYDIGGEHRGALVVACLIAFMIFNSGGIQVIGWLIGSEIYPLRIRDRATGAHAAMLWGSNLLLTGTALSMTHWLGVGGAMWVYAALNALGFAFVFLFLPETAGRTLEEVETSLRDGTFLPFAREPGIPEHS